MAKLDSIEAANTKTKTAAISEYAIARGLTND
jgi:hypothetical protein